MIASGAMRSCVAEAIGTFALVLVGTGAIVVNDQSGGSLSHVGVSLAFGLVVMTMVVAVGDVSGAHLNPAVTLGFWAARRLPANRVAPYVASQATGALAASALLALATTTWVVPRACVSKPLDVEQIASFVVDRCQFRWRRRGPASGPRAEASQVRADRGVVGSTALEGAPQ